MTNPIFNPQPNNYSGVTIQITNPAVYAGQCDGKNSCINSNNNVKTQQSYGYNRIYDENSIAQKNNVAGVTNPIKNSEYPNSYPAQYYMNSYNYGVNGDGNTVTGPFKDSEKLNNTNKKNIEDIKQADNYPIENNNDTNGNNINSYKMYAQKNNSDNNDLTKSQNIIEDLNEREAEIQKEKENTKETKIVALTDEYIKSLENYLDNPNDEIRLMASKEILTRLDEDKDRYDDAALNALLNKMMQDPNKLVRISALSAFASQLASGNDYTVQLLHNIQSNPNADKEDVLQAADILLKMSAGVEVKNIPNPSVKDKKEQ